MTKKSEIVKDSNDVKSYEMEGIYFPEDFKELPKGAVIVVRSGALIV